MMSGMARVTRSYPPQKIGHGTLRAIAPTYDRLEQYCVNCPVCGDMYTFPSGYELLPDGTKVIQFHCEPHEHRFDLRFEHSKGNTYLIVEPLRSTGD
jgi:hypothetical protein